ncbi:hypothetical protein [Bosea sp. 117]|uniref:hypothetical protein n=1 Tax=Bosea sp. 117 TaxID=1125973 RepID=UPI000493DE55|nr:hypothetical protein [Bosea sp. 117]
MISERTVLAAVERGILTSEQAARLRSLDAELAPAAIAAAPQDDERLRFISGFGDIFVTLGLALFLGALAYFARVLGAAGMAGVLVLASWLLAEFFTRRQRMALPSIVLLVVFCVSVFVALANALAGTDELVVVRNLVSGGGHPVAVALAGLVTVGAAALHYWRFRVPITPAAGAAALVATALGVTGALVPGVLSVALNPLLVACGLAVFALAMRFDLSDPARETRRTDIAFWLHLLAAPLIVHPLLSGFAADVRSGGTGAAWPILGTFVVLGLIAVLIDRRALLVSGLIYAGIAFGSLIRDAGLSGTTTPLTVLALGAFVLLLSAAWHPLRRAILSVLPSGLARRLPHPSVASPS